MSTQHTSDRWSDVAQAAFARSYVHPPDAPGTIRLRLTSPQTPDRSLVEKFELFRRKVEERFQFKIDVVGGGYRCWQVIGQPKSGGINVRRDQGDAISKIVALLRMLFDPYFRQSAREAGIRIVASDELELRHDLNAASERQNVDVAFIAPLHYPEFTELRQVLIERSGGNETVVGDERYYRYGLYSDALDPETKLPSPIDVIATYLSDSTNVCAAIATTKLILTCQPKSIVLVGTAGCVARRDLKVGDVVIADQVFHFDARRKYEGNHVEHAPLTFRSDRHLLDKAKQLIAYEQFLDYWRKNTKYREGAGENTMPVAKVGDIASLDAVVNSREFKQQIYRVNRKFVAVEMEAAGMMQAVDEEQKARPRAIVVRGISDDADGSKTDHFMEDASKNASSFAVHFMRNLSTKVSPKTSKPPSLESKL